MKTILLLTCWVLLVSTSLLFFDFTTPVVVAHEGEEAENSAESIGLLVKFEILDPAKNKADEEEILITCTVRNLLMEKITIIGSTLNLYDDDGNFVDSIQSEEEFLNDGVIIKTMVPSKYSGLFPKVNLFLKVNETGEKLTIELTPKKEKKQDIKDPPKPKPKKHPKNESSDVTELV